uniref:Uncharacterized protein n=1 Tax=Cucumis melo TaxID=3656 RepID=A0A9I9EN13_CUCME
MKTSILCSACISTVVLGTQMGKAEKLVLNLGNGRGQIMFFWLIVLLNSAEQNHVLWIQQTFQTIQPVLGCKFKASFQVMRRRSYLDAKDEVLAACRSMKSNF